MKTTLHQLQRYLLWIDFPPEAAGVVQAVAPTVETTSESFRVQYQGDLVVGKLSMGVGSLRTSVAGSLQAK